MMAAPNGVPESSVLRVQLLLAARGGCRDEVAETAGTAAGEAAVELGDVARVILLSEIPDDPFPAANPLCRPFDVVLEVQIHHDVGLGVVVDAFGDFGSRVEEHVHVDLSGVLVGAPHEIIPCDPMPMRYLYFMRRRAHTTRDAYLDYYFHQHSRFGFRTPNITGYTQFHVDPELSAAAARQLGMGSTVCDSVSELHLGSLEAFFAGAMADERLGAEAAADEERFADRANSVSICTVSQVVAP
jgi:hypothetical protein